MQQPMWIKQLIPLQRRVHYASEIGIDMSCAIVLIKITDVEHHTKVGQH